MQNLVNVNSQIAALMIVALGQLVVVLIGGIDISVGSVVSLTSVLIGSFEPALAVPVAMALSLAVGLTNGIGVASFGVHPLVMTLASMTFVQGLALLILSGAGGEVSGLLIAMSKSNIAGFPAAFVWCVAAIFVVSVLLYKSAFGLRIFAIGAGAQSAELSGVAVTGPRIVCYMLCSLSGAIAGIISPDALPRPIRRWGSRSARFGDGDRPRGRAAFRRRRERSWSGARNDHAWAHRQRDEHARRLAVFSRRGDRHAPSRRR